MDFIQLLDYNTIQAHDTKYEIMSFMKIVEHYFKFTPDMIDRLEYIYNISIRSIPRFFHKIRYENVIIGIAVYVIDEFANIVETEQIMQSNNIVRFIEYLYPNDAKPNIIHVYRVRNAIDKFLNN